MFRIDSYIINKSDIQNTVVQDRFEAKMKDEEYSMVFGRKLQFYHILKHQKRLIEVIAAVFGSKLLVI